MKNCLPITLLAAALAPVCTLAQPTIRTTNDGVLNAASYAIPPLPNSSIAQGSLFAIFGTDLGPSPGVVVTGVTTLPTMWPASNGSTVQAMVNGTAVSAFLIYVSATQINALLPSNTPTGMGTITVTYNGATSATHAITVVPSSVGIFTIAQSGTGPGVFTDFQNSNKVVTYTAAANPGDRVTAWLTGLYPITGDDSQIPPPGAGTSLTASNAQVWVGNTMATRHYFGRSGCCAGEDQVSFDVPNVLGCNVPVVIQTTGGSSNFVTMAIAAPGSRTCMDSTTGLAGTDFKDFTSGTRNIGSVVLERTTSTEPPPVGTGTPVTTDSGSASFEHDVFSGQSGSGLSFNVPNIGGCYVYTFTGQTATQTGSFSSTGLDAGPAINIKSPSNATGHLLPVASQTGLYEATLGSNSSTSSSPLFLSPGTATVDNGSGGADVKGFSFNIDLNTGITWDNQDSISTITRSQGVTVTWSNAGSNAMIQITGSSINIPDVNDSTSAVGGVFVCLTSGDHGSFLVPPPVTSALPPSTVFSEGGFTVQTGSLSVGTESTPVKFTATGLDIGYGQALTSISSSVTYQ